MTGPRCAVRITVTGADVDDFGYVSSDAQRRIRALLWDVPTGAVVRVDLGPVRPAGAALFVASLAELPSASGLRFELEHADWRTAHAATLELIAAMPADEVTR